jgi:epoxyqueuosine reductase
MRASNLAPLSARCWAIACPASRPYRIMRNSTSEEMRAAIRARCTAEGFDIVRFARAAAVPDKSAALQEFLGHEHHGDMAWMETRAESRGHPNALWPNAKGIIVLGANYAPSTDPRAALTEKNAGVISVYAKGDDYHDVLKKKLRRLAGAIAQDFDADVKFFVDTAPVMEKPLAQSAGIGWQGKHTNLVSREFGSWLFLASIFTTLDLGEDDSEIDHCGSCRACLDSCPTDAFPAPYRLDARRCISYLTIEHKDAIPEEFREAIGNRIYGCDDCLAACPWNKFAQDAREVKFHARAELGHVQIADLLQLNDTDFRTVFSTSPIKRIGRDRFLRNVLIAAGNSGNTVLLPRIEALLTDPSPLVRGMAVWALNRINPALARVRIAERFSSETEQDVRTEMERALS